jgi:hypothetical protein
MPRYRARRPLMSIVGWLGAAGRPGAIPIALLAITVVAVGLGCAATGRMCTAFGQSQWWGLFVALIPGVGVAVMFGTAEALAVALSAVGICSALQRRYLHAGIAFAFAGLTKETYLAFAAAIAGYLLFRSGGLLKQRVLHALEILAPGAVALIAWWGYVDLAIDDTGSISGASSFTLPFAGWLSAIRTIAQGRYVADAPVGPFGPVLVLGSLALIIVSAVLAVRARTMLAWVGLVWAVYGVCLDGGVLQARFLSGMRTLAPSVFAAALVVVTCPPWRSYGLGSSAGNPHGRAESTDSLSGPP